MGLSKKIPPKKGVVVPQLGKGVPDIVVRTSTTITFLRKSMSQYVSHQVWEGVTYTICNASKKQAEEIIWITLVL